MRKPSFDQSKINYFGGGYYKTPFIDWFCTDLAMERKVPGLKAKTGVIFHANETGNRFDPKMVQVSFKNNFPMVGKLYDSIILSDGVTGGLLFVIDLSVCQYEGRTIRGDVKPPVFFRVWTRDSDIPVVQGNWAEVVEYFSRGGDSRRMFATGKMTKSSFVVRWVCDCGRVNDCEFDMSVSYSCSSCGKVVSLPVKKGDDNGK